MQSNHCWPGPTKPKKLSGPALRTSRSSFVTRAFPKDAFEVIITLIEAYEAKHFPVDLPTPIDAIKFRMDNRA